jgi:hypothetical protein
VTKLTNFGITGGLALTRLVEKVKNQKKMGPRLVKDKRLAKLAEETLRRYYYATTTGPLQKQKAPVSAFFGCHHSASSNSSGD